MQHLIDSITEAEHLQQLQQLSDKYEQLTPTQRTQQQVIKQMVRQEAAITESWVIRCLRKRGVHASKNSNATATDVIVTGRNGSQHTVEIKFRAGPRPDAPGASPNFFLEKYTYVSSTALKRKSQTWIDKPDYYTTVFSDGSLWTLKYAAIRTAIEDNADSTLPFRYYTTRFDTYGVLLRWDMLLQHGLLLRCEYNAATI